MLFVATGLLVMVMVAATAIRFCVVFPVQPFTGQVSALDDSARAMALRLETHVRAVASRPHNLDHPEALEASADYIEQTLRDLGYTLKPQAYRVGSAEVRNIEVLIEPAVASTEKTKTLIVGAHYDSPGDSPGANDNGTGVAALLELARGLKNLRSNHRLRLVFFVNEEHPYGKTPDMGSYQHAKAMRDTGEQVVGMIALETLGHFSDKPGSQRFPFPFGWIYPDRGNFVAFVGMPRARSFVNRCVTNFRATTPFPAIGGVAPARVEGIDLSDHWAYDHFGFPACMATDTAPFRNPFYHSPLDTPDTVDYTNLARVTTGLETMVRGLACEAQQTPLISVPQIKKPNPTL